ncbi:putative Na+ efflux ABC transporter, permease component [Beutenbergia cavernae DSM 12333]|uniref:Putative Na+ efflux ABC transporter, permease component n=1 Tax=Beutenbergia cavernae (strain ATCC BAA-8 / DSM 12333 / CCUG 43141 / JCM 11478 / NBRC 16432 / NCIMB 13614 / HKI 0122) TaxID=471853 RepID=C5BZU4_BEUC1|nr:ABC transporter permease [Beutenbergia cavernae]ACQ81274.1 putative Na+ efflux ABC transporter, permease component [Beutenbergia cavernae DSM 12333]
MTTQTPTRERTGAGGRRPMSFGAASLLVAEREITTQVRSKSFLISTAITLVIVLGGIIVSSLIGGGPQDDTRVAVVAGTADAVSSVEGIEAVPADDAAAAEELVRSGDVAAALVPDAESELGFTVVALTEAPADVLSALSVTPPVELLEETATNDGIRYLVSLAFGLVFMMSAIGSGSMIAQNTVQEKQTRIVEILLSAVPARALLAGKVLGNSVVAVGQTAAIGAVAALGLVLTGQNELLDLLSAPLVWFVVFFLVGFVLVAAIFAAGASLVSRQEDIGSVMMPAMMLVMIPYFVVVFLNDNPVAMTIASYVPFSAPVAMPVRLFLGEAAWWEPLLSLAVLVVTTLGVVAVAARIYTGSLLRTGPRVSVRAALGRD